MSGYSRRGQFRRGSGKPPDELTEAEVRDIAMRYLARRDYSELELARKLRQRGVSGVMADSVTAALTASGLVSDARFAEVFTRHRFNGHYGPARIRAELRSRGVVDALIAEALAPYQEAWRDSALAWVRKRLRGDLDRKAQARLYRGGMNRGFSHDHIMRAIEQARGTG